MKIALIYEWPGKKYFEKEFINRCDRSLSKLGHGILVIDRWGRILNKEAEYEQNKPPTFIQRGDVDFTIATHFQTLKTYDTFSYVTYWYPIYYLHPDHSPSDLRTLEFISGQNFINVILSHDDVLNVTSEGLQNSYLDILAGDSYRKFLPNPNLLFVTCDPLEEVKPIDFQKAKVFYIGVNWEYNPETSNKGRHYSLLKLLDEHDSFEFYGPKKFIRGNEKKHCSPWSGFRQYRGEIPFGSGIDVVKKCNELGIVLEISANEFRESEILSSRVFQGLAASALVIADDNMFNKKHFKGCLLTYKFYQDDPERTAKNILDCVNWTHENPDAAREITARGHQLFKEKYSLTRQLKKIIDNHPKRKALIEKRYHAQRTEEKISIIVFWESLNVKGVEIICQMLDRQSYQALELLLVCDLALAEELSGCIDAYCRKLSYKILPFELYFHKKRKINRGMLLAQIIPSIDSSYIAILIHQFIDGKLAKTIQLKIDHFTQLKRPFEDCNQIDIVHSGVYMVNQLKFSKTEQCGSSFLHGWGIIKEEELFGKFQSNIELGSCLFRKSMFSDSSLLNSLKLLDNKLIELILVNSFKHGHNKIEFNSALTCGIADFSTEEFTGGIVLERINTNYRDEDFIFRAFRFNKHIRQKFSIYKSGLNINLTPSPEIVEDSVSTSTEQQHVQEPVVSGYSLLMGNRSFISHAPNFEDVMLWRAFKHLDSGFYIDVGACDQGAVTRGFYDRGWCGINIEPQSSCFEMLLAGRPRDINLQSAVGAESGEAILFEIQQFSNLATLDKTIAETHESKIGFPKIEKTILVRTITDICDEFKITCPIHFLKIDVNGWEKQVLQGIDFSKIRPWIILINSVLPLSQIACYENWESILLSKNYEFVYFDGMKRFYITKELSQLKKNFCTPPNWFDDFRLAADQELCKVASEEQRELACRNLYESKSWRITYPLRRLSKYRQDLLNRYRGY